MRLRLPQDRRSRIALVCVGLFALLIIAAVGYLWSVDRARERAAELDRVIVEEHDLVAPNAVGVSFWLSDEAPRDVEPFNGHVFAATAAGLAMYDERGGLVRRFTTLDGLPENSLLCLERFGNRLFIGTESNGLVAFDGERFTRFTFVRPEAARVSALRAVPGELLVGTFDAGVFEYDGQNFSRRYQRAFGDSCRRVTAFLDVGPRLYVGTYDAGLFEWREAVSHVIGKAQGLPSDRVTGVALQGSSILVATDLGIAAIDGANGDSVTVVDAMANTTGLAIHGNSAWASSLGRGVTRLDRSADAGSTPTRPVADTTSGAGSTGDPISSAIGVKVEDDAVWAMSPDGLFVATSVDGPLRFERFDAPSEHSVGLESGHVAALGLDARGRLWAGLFDGGIDVLDPGTGERVDRVDDPLLHEINAIVADRSANRLWVASSRGLASFDGARRSRLLGERDGLVGENVAGIALGAGQSGDGLVVATNEGVTVVDGIVPRSITAFNGLPNKHTYAVTVLDGKTYVGTLGGLAVLDGLRVNRIYTSGNSKLPHNWVNALASADGRLYVGTYGGGVATLLPTGELVPAEETAGFEVNPGAMLVVGRRLYVGTLRSGLYALDLDTGRWTRIASVLSSTNVTALAADDRNLYVGTEHGITRIERSAIGHD